MSKPQIIRTPAGEEMVVLSRAEYEALLDVVEVIEDAAAAERSLARIASGEEELISESELDDYLAAPTPLAFWRKKRGSTAEVLAERAGLSPACFLEIEGGQRPSTSIELRKLADTLKISVDDLVE